MQLELRVVLLLLMSTTVKMYPIKSISEVQNYLSEYGYLFESDNALLDRRAYSAAIMDFQTFAGLNVTGDVDELTMQMMGAARCGMKDKHLNTKRHKRFTPEGSRWRNRNLSYRISRYPRAMSRQQVDVEIFRAFNVWSEYTDLTFRPKALGPVHIDIRFETDGDRLNGPGNVLAYAYFPIAGGDARFDNTEEWTMGTPRGTNLFQVAAHEFGHSLGLEHSSVKEALMAPFYNNYEPNFRLHPDDIQGIQTIYGPKGSTRRRPPPRRRFGSFPWLGQRNGQEEPTNLCLDSKIDAIFNSSNSDTYVFKGDLYYRIDNDASFDEYPKHISEGWEGLPGNIDAAFTDQNDRTYFFKGSKCWCYSGYDRIEGYPKDIDDEFPGVPDNIDSAFAWGENGTIYFFKGNQFWQYDSSETSGEAIQPKPMSIWNGVPNDIDGALQHANGFSYFFKGDVFYTFNDHTFSTTASPRSIGEAWFECPNSNTIDDDGKPESTTDNFTEVPGEGPTTGWAIPVYN